MPGLAASRDCDPEFRVEDALFGEVDTGQRLSFPQHDGLPSEQHMPLTDTTPGVPMPLIS
jgi:hypothetical protein